MTAPGTAVVTGGGRDIGAAICGRLAAAGLAVVVAGDAATDGGLTAWVDNAGIDGAMQPTTSYPAETFALVMQVNVHGVFLGMQAALSHMLAAGAGAIARAYAGRADVEQSLLLINQYPPENVGWLGRLRSDNPMIVDVVTALNA